VYGQYHPDRSTILGLGAGVNVLLKPEVRSLDSQLSDDHLSGVILKAVALDRTERGLVIVHRLCGPADRQPRGDAGLDRFGLGCTGAHHSARTEVAARRAQALSRVQRGRGGPPMVARPGPP